MKEWKSEWTWRQKTWVRKLRGIKKKWGRITVRTSSTGRFKETKAGTDGRKENFFSSLFVCFKIQAWAAVLEWEMMITIYSLHLNQGEVEIDCWYVQTFWLLNVLFHFLLHPADYPCVLSSIITLERSTKKPILDIVMCCWFSPVCELLH